MTRTATGFRRPLTFLGVLALALMSVFLPAVRANAASNVQVFLGYADNLRAAPTNFPTPWAGSPGVIMQGCTGCTYDSGAIRVVNNSPLPVTVNSVAVKFGTCVFDIWPHGTSVPANGQLIDTQLNANFVSGCTANGSFDSSDLGPNGIPWGSCSQTGVIPEVDVTIDGTQTVFPDSGQVLNTGGEDKAACGDNESTQWTSIGSQPCPGATLSLAPASQNATIGSPATVKATLANTCGVGLQGASIHFADTSGPDSGTSGDATTDVNGNASFTYTGNTPGTDSLVATTTNPAGTITSNTASVIWGKRTASLNVAATTGDFDDPTTVSGVLSDNLGPIAGQPVTLTLDNAESCTATTDSTGTASCQITPHEAAGPYPLAGTFAGDAADNAATGSNTFTVTHEQTSLAYTGSNRAANGQPYTASGVLTEDGTTPIAGRTVTFTLGSGASAQTCTGTTDSAGAASCQITVNQPSSESTFSASGSFAGDAFYSPSASGVAIVGLNYLTGDAYGISSSGLVNISKTPEAGPVQTSTAENVTLPCVVTISGLINAGTLCASVVTSVNPGTSTANASVQHLSVGVPLLPAIQIGAVQSTSTSTCTGSSGDARIASISVAGIPLNINVHPGPNTTISVAGITIILNEQIPVPGADHGLTVNAVHIKALGLLDVTVASSTSDIHNC